MKRLGLVVTRTPTAVTSIMIQITVGGCDLKTSIDSCQSKSLEQLGRSHNRLQVTPIVLAMTRRSKNLTQNSNSMALSIELVAAASEDNQLGLPAREVEINHEAFFE